MSIGLSHFALLVSVNALSLFGENRTYEIVYVEYEALNVSTWRTQHILIRNENVRIESLVEYSAYALCLLGMLLVTCAKTNLSLVWIATFLSSLLFCLHEAIHLYPYFSLFVPCAVWTLMSLVTYKRSALSTLFLGFSYFHGAILALVTFRASAPVTVAVGLITSGIALTGCFFRVSRYGALAYSGSCLVVGFIASTLGCIEIRKL